MKMSGKDVVTLLIVFGGGGYAVYGSETGTGLGGWLNYAQQAIFGVYDVSLSLILFLGLVGALAAIAIFAWDKVSGSRDGGEQNVGSRILFGPKTTSATPPASQQGRALLQGAIICVVATWTIGFAIYWRYASEQREDASAQYEPIDLSDGAPIHQPRGSHIALQGSVPLSTALSVKRSHKTGYGYRASRADYQLVPLGPIASHGLVKGQAVAFVLRIEVEDSIPISPFTQPAATGVLMARIDGPVPGPVALEFERAGVPLGKPNYFLRPVKTKDGKIITESIEDAFMFYLVFSGFVTLFTAWLVRSKAARKGSL